MEIIKDKVLKNCYWRNKDNIYTLESKNYILNNNSFTIEINIFGYILIDNNNYKAFIYKLPNENNLNNFEYIATYEDLNLAMYSITSVISDFINNIYEV